MTEFLWVLGNFAKMSYLEILVLFWELSSFLNAPKHDVVALFVEAKIIALLLVLVVKEILHVKAFWILKFHFKQTWLKNLVLNVLSVGMDHVFHPFSFFDSG